MKTTKATPNTAINKHLLAAAIIMLGAFATGCASVPLASPQADAAAKRFNPPTNGMAGVYIYRDSFVGKALKKYVAVDNRHLGLTANKVYFHTTVTPGLHKLASESEFVENTLNFEAIAGLNYFFEQYITMGVIIGGSNLRAVSENEGKANVLKCRLAQ